jgi:Zn-dependent protease
MHQHEQDGPTPQPTAGLAPFVVDVVTDAPADEFEVSVLGELEKIRNRRGNWAQALIVLAVSLLLFLGLGRRDNPVAFTAMLVGVLFFHELGHYVGMRIFGYRNVRMFFIPLFGAAVSGQKTTAKSYQEAIVTLLGPLPGLLLAVVLFSAALIPGPAREYRLALVQGSLLLGLINGFNLLPVFPLDGGRLLNQILFSRNRYLECIFQFLAAIALIAYGVARGAMSFWFLAIWILVTVGPTFKSNTIAQRVGRQFGDELPPIDGPIPIAVIRAIVEQMRSLLPRVKAAKDVARAAFGVWEKMHVRPPSAVAATALLVVYLLAEALSVPWLLLLFRPAARA